MIRTGKDLILVIVTLVAVYCLVGGACLLDTADAAQGVKMMIVSGIWLLLFIAANFERFRDLEGRF